MKDKVIYLDSHATTRVDQDVLAAMLPYFTEHYANGNHAAGWTTNTARENARGQVAGLIGAKPTEITFTSGATEAINMALLGLARNDTSGRRHIITQKTEHPAVLSCIEALGQEGFEITMLDVDDVGRIDLEELKQIINEQTLVVAIMLANNEIGTVQPVEEIGKLCRESGARFFCDLTQGLGWYSIDVNKLNIDMASISSHKVYGPRGVGALYLRRRNPRVLLAPLQFGGGQERGLRPGTHNVPGIVGFGKACELLAERGDDTFSHVRSLRDRLQRQLLDGLEGVKINGCLSHRHPGNLNMAIKGVTGEALIGQLPNIMFSTTSACGSGSAKPSHVIAALGADDEQLRASFRMGVGKYNTAEEIDYVAFQVIDTVKSLRSKLATIAV